MQKARAKPTRLRDRFEPSALAAYGAVRLPCPVHALNLVRFRDRRSYLLYGLLFAPYGLARGARALWAAVLDIPLLGEVRADEIALVSYPGPRTLADIVTSGYYSWVNRWRVRGTSRLEFGLTEPAAGSISLRLTGPCAVVQHNDDAVDATSLASEVAPVLRLRYASRVRAGFPAMLGCEPGDPEPLHYRHTLLLTPGSGRLSRNRLLDAARRLASRAGDLTFHLYRGLSLREALSL
ncbi:hypothetical protein FJY71_00040 [candidate division WOR-3 bacterium]|nr:hypothetical protein [candidate division WOR-3 bacterium]